jgi:uncharacterized protein YkwD
MVSSSTLARRRRPVLEELEPRRLLAGFPPTAVEQLFLERLNDARANPAAYGAAIGVDLSGVAPSQPLAFDTRLIQAARQHSQDMNDRAYFSHITPEGIDPGQRMTAVGFPWLGWGESIAAGYPTPDAALQGLIIDSGVPDLGHRRHLLAIDASFKPHNQIGIGAVQNGGGPYSDYWTLDSGYTADSRPFITGVVFRDDNGNGRYDLGEGLPGVTITVSGVGSFPAWDTGGYSIQVNPGTYVVVASGGGLPAPVSHTVTVGGANVRLNFVPGPVQVGPGTIQLSAAAYNVSDRGGSLTVLVTRSPGSTGAVTVDYATGDGSAAAGVDYTAVSGTLSFAPGQMTQAVTIPILYDGRADGNETFVVALSNPTGGARLGGPAAALVTVADVLAPPANLTPVANQLTHSAESYAYFITQAYLRYLGRGPDGAGLSYWVGRMQGGLSDERLEAGFLGSAEYIANHGGTASGWVVGMYHDLLGRDPDPQGLSYWVARLAAGANPADVAYGFAASAERESTRINGDYLALLGRPADPQGLSYWLSAFLAGARNEDLVGGFLGSAEYYLNSGKGHGNKAGWVASAFLDALHRAASADDLLAWSNVLIGS